LLHQRVLNLLAGYDDSIGILYEFLVWEIQQKNEQTNEKNDYAAWHLRFPLAIRAHWLCYIIYTSLFTQSVATTKKNKK